MARLDLKSVEKAWADVLLRGEPPFSLDDRSAFDYAVCEPFVSSHWDALQVYRRLLRGGVMGCLEGLFPQTLVALSEKQRWQLMECFRREYPNTSPQFMPMFQPFVDFLKTQPDVPEPIIDMARYEWAQSCSRHAPDFVVNPDLDHLSQSASAEWQWILNPTLTCLVCDWPVHELQGVDYFIDPLSWYREATQLIVFRQPATHAVKTFVLNPLMAGLVRMIQSKPEWDMNHIAHQLVQQPDFQVVSSEQVLSALPNVQMLWVQQGVVVDLQQVHQHAKQSSTHNQ